jgi:putative two-component system response regulator
MSRVTGAKAEARTVEEKLDTAYAQLAAYAKDLNKLRKSERESVRQLQSAYQQLFQYATDLKKTYAAERKRAQEVQAAYVEAIHRLTVAAEYKDEDTANHIRRISHYSKVLAPEMGWKPQMADLLFEAAPMHDVGKIGVPDSILLKPGPLTPEEWKVMKAHPAIGAGILFDSPSPLIKMASEIAATHHERWDGSGYPNGLKGDEIPLSGRIVMLADQYDALRSKRPYKPPFDHEKTCDIILNGDGRTLPSHFQPKLLQAFVWVKDAFAEIYGSHVDA